MRYTTAIEEKKIRDQEKAKRSRKYRYQPAGFDTLDPNNRPRIEPGTLVVKIQVQGCPRNGTMGHCYIGWADTGEFIGLVDEKSLIPVSKVPKEKGR